MLSFVIASAASQRGRGPFSWFLLSILTTPVLAALLLLLFPPVDGLAMIKVNDVALSQAIEQADSPRTKKAGLLVAVVLLVGTAVTMHWGAGGVPEAVKAVTVGLITPTPRPLAYQRVATMPCVNFLNALGTNRFAELTDVLIETIGAREGGLGSTINMTSYVLTECRLGESKTIGQAIDGLFEQKRRGRLPLIPIGGATNDVSVQASWTEFRNWIHHVGPRPDFRKGQ